MSEASTPVDPATHRSRPRRRGSALENAILTATIAEIDRHGYTDLSIERIAARARASKASLYRRWPSKVALVLAAIGTRLPPPDAPIDTGSLRGDLLAVFRTTARGFAGPAGVAIRGLVSDALRDPGTANQLRHYTQGRSLSLLQEVIHRSGQRGELVPEALTQRQLEAGLSMLRFALLIDGAPLDDRTVVGIVDEVVLPLLQAVADPAGLARRKPGSDSPIFAT